MTALDPSTVLVLARTWHGWPLRPEAANDTDYQGCGVPDLAKHVRQCPLMSAAGGGDGYSPGYSILRLRQGWSLDL